jgi:ribosomal protein L3 glutamine methyltransferase
LTGPRAPAQAAPGTVRGWWRRIEHQFAAARLAYGHGTSNARDEAAWLVCHALRIPFGELDDALDRPVPLRVARRLERLARQRIETRKPMAYLLHEAWLLDHRFYVDSRVIVPRSHLAALLPAGLAPWFRGRGPARILDLCTGSGCLAILAAHAFPGARVDASDVSRGALAVARRNVAGYRLGRRIRLVQSDLFVGLATARYDLILCNPPYVPARDMRRLPREFRHEPELALASGRDGLDFVRRLLREAGAHLRPQGILVVEVGDGRAGVERAFPGIPFVWLETSGGSEAVFLVPATDLRG